VEDQELTAKRMKNRPLHVRIGFALSGIRECWRTERSFKTQTVAGLLAGMMLVVVRPEPIWWAIVALVTMAILALELLNSALERMIDHLHPEQHPEVGAVKDMAAGGVLVLSAGAVLVATALLVSVL
jgi:undecaprenol kinase